MKGAKSLKPLKVAVPAQEAVDKFLTASGTFTDGDLRLNQKGLQLTSERAENPVQQPDVKEEDMQFSLEDFETIKVIGKGSGGVVQLVRHKWLGTLFALKKKLPSRRVNWKRFTRFQQRKGLVSG